MERVCRAYSRPDVAYRLLQQTIDVRATKPELSNPRRDGGLDLLPFLGHATLLPRGSGGMRRAALRPFDAAPVLVPPTCVGLPNRDAAANASRDVRTDVHGSKDRAKDASPAHATISRACDGCIRFVAHADVVPLLGDLRTSAVIGAFRATEEPLHADGPTEVFVPALPREERRLPEGRDAFHRHDTRRNATRRDRSLRPSRRLSRSRRPHFVPRLGKVSLVGHCKATVRSPAGSVADSRVLTPF